MAVEAHAHEMYVTSTTNHPDGSTTIYRACGYPGCTHTDTVEVGKK